jgi:hypothetical protein
MKLLARVVRRARGIKGRRTSSAVGDDEGDVATCPYCGGTVDLTDIGDVLTHYDHQLAAGQPAVDKTPRRKPQRSKQ